MSTTDIRHERALVWFRRDLRDFDHAALYAALKHSRAVYCAFVFDREILDALPRGDDPCPGKAQNYSRSARALPTLRAR